MFIFQNGLWEPELDLDMFRLLLNPNTAVANSGTLHYHSILQDTHRRKSLNVRKWQRNEVRPHICIKQGPLSVNPVLKGAVDAKDTSVRIIHRSASACACCNCRSVLMIHSVMTHSSGCRRLLCAVPRRCCLWVAQRARLWFCTLNKKRKKST